MKFMATSTLHHLDTKHEADHWFTAAIATSVIWSVFVILVISMRKKIQTVSSLFLRQRIESTLPPLFLVQTFHEAIA